MLRVLPPESVRHKLQSLGIADADHVISASTDIDQLGRYEPQWLIATADRLVICSGGPDPSVLHDLRFSDITEFRCQSVVGSGLLQARVNNLYVDLLRYSNRLGDQFSKIARKLDRYLHGDPIVIYPEDDVDARRCPSCGLLLEFPGEACPRCVNKGAVFSRMLKLMRPYRTGAFSVMALLMVGISLDLVTPQLTRYLVDHVLPGTPEAASALQSSPTLTLHHFHLLLTLVAILAAVQILRMVVSVINGRAGASIGTAITADMRSRLVQHLEQLGVAYYDRQQVGSLVSRVSYDTEALHGFVNQLTGGFLFQIIMIIGVGIMMLSINPKLAMFTLIPAPVVVAGSFFFWRYIYPRYYRYWDSSSKQAGMLAGMLSGIRVVKAFNQEARETQRFDNASQRLKAARRGVDLGVNTFNPIMGLIFQFGGWVVWYVGGRDVINQQMTLGELMAFFGYLWMFYGPLATLTQLTNWLTQFVTQAHRIFEILDTPIQITESQEPADIAHARGEIEFQAVSFGYNRHSPVLRDINLRIAPGEMVGIVGRSGSGKSTIVNLICRFYDPDEGCVMLDSVDVRDVARGDLRSRIGVVLQEPFLFRGSIWDNLTYGRRDCSIEQALTASRAANCHDFIMRTAHGYDTWVGERGAGLSGGERQRLSIERVLLIDPLILILDEATSSVDAESEAAIQAALSHLVRNRTTIAIAHRLSTLRIANRILVLDNGRIVEQGSHDELLANDALYARLVRLQGQEHPPTVDRLAHQSEQARETAAPEYLPRWLTPATARIHLGSHNALHVTVIDDRIYGGVFAVRCLPVRYPSQFISLRYLDTDKREREVGLVRDLNDWPDDVQQLLRQSLLKRYFVHTITAIHDIQTISGYISFSVDTDLGPMQFMIRWQSDRAQDYGPSGKMLLDTDENRYLIPDIHQLPERDRRLFQRYIYW